MHYIMISVIKGISPTILFSLTLAGASKKTKLLAKITIYSTHWCLNNIFE